MHIVGKAAVVSQKPLRYSREEKLALESGIRAVAAGMKGSDWIPDS